MVQSASWEANRFSANKEIPRILWNPKVYHRVYKSHPKDQSKPEPIVFLS
jgi:hypothetical protein